MLISVVITTYHRDEALAKALRGVESQSFRDFEVVVTDDARSPATREMLAREFPQVRWVEGPSRGPAANRNNGAYHARGEWLVFLDDDCIPDPHWLSGYVDLIRSGKYDVIEGKIVIPDPVDTPFAHAVENLTGGNFWSANLAIQRAMFERIGGFDEDFLEPGGEDMEFAFRIQDRKLRTRFAPDALIFHPMWAHSWKSLLKRTLGIRWILMYELKTGKTLPLDAPPLRVLSSLAVSRSMHLSRRTWQVVRDFDPHKWRTNLFYTMWNWVTFPVILPYMMMWAMRFRADLRSKP